MGRRVRGKRLFPQPLPPKLVLRTSSYKSKNGAPEDVSPNCFFCFILLLYVFARYSLKLQSVTSSLPLGRGFWTGRIYYALRHHHNPARCQKISSFRDDGMPIDPHNSKKKNTKRVVYLTPPGHVSKAIIILLYRCTHVKTISTHTNTHTHRHKRSSS